MDYWDSYLIALGLLGTAQPHHRQVHAGLSCYFDINYFDYDYINARCNPHPSLAGFYPLWASLATGEQATRMVDEWLHCFE